MLVITRRPHEAIVINGNIVVTLVEIRGDKVRIGIEAPRDAAVHRREVFEAIRQASPTPPADWTSRVETSVAPPVPPAHVPLPQTEAPIFFG